ncbi:hypothetical protein [Frigoriflavimonas asaccharolytica]|uniref:Uncharacterized protein n=1 Tax=Frigoriflavimonas asaccharolytica TaxID=2735899 RepID=A0A8J8G923_9FLAO|nr:hypothetical protein [Frigoriflavimonas asaccharolytica]NRS91222.1 hypothetical protein [Frigoriflavimonas asaccharolytica]
MEKYAFLLLIILFIGIALSAVSEGKYVTKARWLQGIITVSTIIIISLWFVLQSNSNLEQSTILTKNTNQISKTLEKTFILGTAEERSRLATIKFSILTSLNFLLLFLNAVLLIKNVILERKVIVQA